MKALRHLAFLFFITAGSIPSVQAVLTVSSTAIQESLPSAGENFPESRFGAPPQSPDLGGHIPAAPRRSIASVDMNPQPVNMREGEQEVALIASDLGFFPKTLFVTQGIPVRLYVTGASQKTLCLMLDAFQIKKQVRSRRIEELSFVPPTPGQFRFYCPVNGMEGTLLVKEGVQKGLDK